jgi:hypothetical protein
MDHMVDSYEIYGDNQNDESEIEEHIEEVQNVRKRPVAVKASAARAKQHSKSRDRHNNDEICERIGEVSIDEHIVEPSKMTKNENYRQNSRTASTNQGNRKASSQARRKERESSGVKKTQIEVLDHETPIEEYKQYYQ